MTRPAAFLALALTALVTVPAAPARAQPVHALAMHGQPKYAPDFKAFDYVNANAPKGGDVRLETIGTFDTFNPYIIKGEGAAGIGLTTETLMIGSADEPFTEYGLLAETIETPPDRSWVAFTLRPEAKFSDGKPVTVDDVVWSFETLKAKGQPFYRLYYKGVVKAEKTGERAVKFTFAPGDNRELPLIVGQMPILSKAWWQGHKFDETTLEVPVGSGPYLVESFEPGRFVTYKRNPAYWGWSVPAMRGQYNFDHIRYDYYRDSTVALEAFKAGEYDFREENEAKKWATGYDFPALTEGRVKKAEIPHGRPAGMQAFAYNIRRPLFQDARVRQALGYAFDFEWANKNLFYGQYTRTESYYANSDLAATGLSSPAELAVLKPFESQLPPQVFTEAFHVPKTDGSGNIRDSLHSALELLKQAGWSIAGGKLVDKAGQPMAFEILNQDPAWERIILPFIENLKRLGIDARLRTVDTSQYKNRLDSYDFDMTVGVWGESLSPGNEQRSFWSSEAAGERGGRNLVGIRNPAVDSIVDAIISAPDRESLVARTHALDRVLLWNYYVIPNWHLAYDRVAYWDRFGQPAKVPTQGVQFMAWWIDPAKMAAQDAGKGH